MMKVLSRYRTNSLAAAGILAACSVGLLCKPLRGQQNNLPFATETTLVSEPGGRAISDIIDHVQQAFLKPITYEEYPFQTNLEQTFSATATLGPQESSPFFAVQTILGSYRAAGLPGQYTVTQTGDRVDVVPAHGPIGSSSAWKPLMSYPVSFEFGSRSVEETLALLANQISAESGYRVILLEFPGAQTDTIQLSAEGRAARDLIEDIGEKMNLTLSFQALYEPDSKLYYLRVLTLAAPLIPGGPPQHGRVRPLPKTGPANSPFFVKDK